VVPGTWISYALLVGLAMALVVAAVTDLRRREIDNGLNAAIALSAPLYWVASGLDLRAILLQLGLAALTLVLSGTLFVARQMGGGDVKLLTALALWLPPGSFGQLAAIMGMVGGGAAVALAVYNMRTDQLSTPRQALATSAATLWIMLVCAFTYGLAMGRPPLSPDDMGRIATALPGGWLLAALAAGVMGLVLYGLRQIFARQRGRAHIPYGVAIAAGGLSVIAASLAAG